MASLAMLIGGALVNALAFSGSNYMFHALEGSDMKRHNLMMEKLTRERDIWNRQRQERLDFINKRLMENRQSQQKFVELDNAMKAYKASNMNINDLPFVMDKPVMPLLTTSDNNHYNAILISLASTTVATGVTYFVVRKYYKKH